MPRKLLSTDAVAEGPEEEVTPYTADRAQTVNNVVAKNKIVAI